jgi:3-hydroxyacyl-CoA dehydrogenase
MKLGMNHPIGPLALADLIGLDTCLSIMDILYTEFRDSKYRACPLLAQLVAAGIWAARAARVLSLRLTYQDGTQAAKHRRVADEPGCSQRQAVDQR